MKIKEIREKVKSRVEDKLEYDVCDWDDMTECDGIDENIIKEALEDLQLKWKNK